MAAKAKRHLLCQVADLPTGSARAFTPAPDLSLFAVRTSEQVHVYRNRCPHAGFELNWLPDRFLDRSGQYIHCQVHGALFSIESGACIAGPCTGAHLEAIPVVEDQGALFVTLEAKPDPKESVSS